MSILIDQHSRVIVQGATGKQGRYHMQKMLEYDVNVVAGISPGKGGSQVLEVPIFDTVARARKKTPIDATLILVPAAGTLDAAAEAILNGIGLVVVITEHVPLHDALIIRGLARKHGAVVIGPNTVGLISPGKCKVGVMPGFIYSEGRVGVISRSGTLTHEIASNLTYRGIGQSTCVCIGGDMSKTVNFTDMLKLFREDPETDAVAMIGEIGGAGEESAARYLKENGYPKKVAAYIAGANAPAEKRMGHAGAIISGGYGSVEEKRKQLESAGVIVVSQMDALLDILKDEGGQSRNA